MFIKEDQLLWFFNKKSSGRGIDTELNYQLASELHSELYSLFRDNIWDADLADVQSLSKYNKVIKYLLCAVDLFSKYVWLVPLKDKKGITIVNGFQKIISKGRKPNKIWVDQGDEFYNNLFKRFLKINNIEMYARYNKGKSVVEIFFLKKSNKKKGFEQRFKS